MPDLSFSEVNFLGNRNRRVSKTAEDSGAEEARRSHKRRREVEKKIHGPSRSEMTTRSRSRTTSMFDTNSHRQPTLPENRTIASVAVYDRRSSSHHSIIRHQDEHSGYSLLGAQSRFADGYDINSSYGDMEIATAHTPDAYIACREKIPVPDYTSVESTEGVEISPFLPDIEDKPVVHQHPEIKRPAHRVVKSSKQPTNPIIEVCATH